MGRKNFAGYSACFDPHGSDHTPLLVDSAAHLDNKSLFSFILSWMRQEGFYEMVSDQWTPIVTGNTPIEIWQNKIRHLRQFLRGWAKNMSGIYKKERDKILLINERDIKAEVVPLSAEERAAKKATDDYLAKLRRDEETKWDQRAKVKHVREGGNNTKYFHLIANGKHRQKRIFQLEQDEGTIVGEANLKLFITEYYKKLFVAPEPNFFSFVEDQVNDIPQLSDQEKGILTANFSEKEIFEAVAQMKHNKAPGPDGFPAEFYQKFWEVLKSDLMAMFVQLQSGDLPFFSLILGL